MPHALGGRSRMMVTTGLLLLGSTTLLAQSSDWTDIASPAVRGENHEHHRGAAWGDYDNDGWIDLYVTHWGAGIVPFPGSSNQLLRNIDGENFEEVTDFPIDVQGGLSHHPLWGDCDNDGRLDLYVTQSSNAGTDISHLFKQSQTGFVDITNGDPLALQFILPRNATWADYNADGWLDLYVCNSGGFQEVNRLMRNTGAGFFVEAFVGIEDTFKHSRSAAWCDYDNDGDQDVYVTSGGQDDLDLPLRTNTLYRNNGDGTFDEVAEAAGVADTRNGRGCAWGDFNNDGWFDLFVGNHSTEPTPGLNILYKNNGDGTFTDVRALAGLDEDLKTRCVSWADFNNDGWLDLYVVNFGGEEPANQLYRNNGDETFTDVAAGTPAAAEPNGNSGAWCDFNNDGWMDLFTVGGSYSLPGTGQNRLLRNDNQDGSHWIELDLVGVVSNRSAIGARVTISAGGMQQAREVQSGSGYNTQHMLRVHFGVGNAEQIDSMHIRWPSGRVQSFANLEVDQFMTVIEPCEVGIECFDCNDNGAADVEDIRTGTSFDCNHNQIPDDCEIADGAPDVDGNGQIDTCEDCNGNGIPDGVDLDDATSVDCNANGRPDECDIASDLLVDCNDDLVADTCQIDADPDLDQNGNNYLDSCEGMGDLDLNGHVDVQDLVIVILNWGACPNGNQPCPADADGSGAVDIRDLLLVLLNWG